METININGIEYVVVKVRDFEHNGHDRQELTLRRPKGRVLYYATKYENGTIGNPVS